MKFKDLKVGDSNIVINALVIDCKIKQTVNQTPYYGLTISDGDDNLDARIWSIALVNNLKAEKIENGEVYKMTVKVNDYAGKNQIIITKIEDPDEDLDLSTFFKSAPINREELEEYILAKMNNLHNPVLRKIVFDCIEPRKKSYFTHPAAVTMHHNYIGGLAHHVYSMLKLAERFKENYPALNFDLLESGILIHDIGKLEEIADGKSPTYSKEGNLLGHIVIGMNILHQVLVMNGYEETEEGLALMHMIASHHGELEYGSPKEPLMLEALALHLIDLTDAKLAGCTEFIQKTPKGSYSNQIPSIGKKAYYVPNIEGEEPK